MTKLSLADIGVIYLPFIKQANKTDIFAPKPLSQIMWGTYWLCADPVGVVSPCHHLCSLEGVASVPHIFCKTNDKNIVQASRLVSIFENHISFFSK